MISDNIDIQLLLQRIGLSTKDPIILNSRSKKVQDLIEGKVILRLSSILSDADIEILKSIPEEEVTSFLTSKGIDLIALVMEETETFIQEMKDNLDSLF